jgi:biopolymer transport protein ExbB/TolQ
LKLAKEKANVIRKSNMSIMMNRRKNCNGRKWLLTTLILLAVFPSAFDSTALATPSQQAAPAPANTPANAMPAPAASSPLEKLTAWDILWMCDWFTWPFIFLTAIGLAFIIHRALLEYRQKVRAHRWLAQPIEYAGLTQLVKLINAGAPNRASLLFQQMLNTFNKTRKAEALQDEVNHYLQSEKDSLDGFNRIVGFLSDTAGALGLLGTVWGIFVVFYAGKMDGPSILKGMSIALITTLVGLIISLLLNLGSLAVFSLFNRQLKLISERAEELRQALLLFQLKSPVSPMSQEPQRPEPARQARPAARPRRERRPEPVVVTEEAIEEWAWPATEGADYTDGVRRGLK